MADLTQLGFREMLALDEDPPKYVRWGTFGQEVSKRPWLECVAVRPEADWLVIDHADGSQTLVPVREIHSAVQVAIEVPTDG